MGWGVVVRAKAKCRGSLHCAAYDGTVSCFGRGDGYFFLVEEDAQNNGHKIRFRRRAVSLRSITHPLRDVQESFRNASKVEPQESCIHPVLSHTARTRPLLCCSPSLSRQK